jgi:hypothetical protein
VLQFRTALSYVDDFDAKNRRGSRLEEEEEKKKAAQKKDMPKHLVSVVVGREKVGDWTIGREHGSGNVSLTNLITCLRLCPAYQHCRQ